MVNSQEVTAGDEGSDGVSVTDGDSLTPVQDDSDSENSNDSSGAIGSGNCVVTPVVSDALTRLEDNRGYVYGEIIDIASFNVSDPYSNFDFDTSRLLNESRQRITQIIDEETYTDCLLLAVELKTYHERDVFIHPFTYEASENDVHDSIISLAAPLNVDVSLIHHLIGEGVVVSRCGNVWEITHHRDTVPDSSVTPWDFALPAFPSAFAIIGGVLAGVQTSVSILITSVAGAVTSLILYFGLLWLYLALKRDHPLPGIIGRLARPSFVNDTNEIAEDTVIDVDNIEVTGVTTLAPESEYDNERVVLHNLAIEGYIPHVGELTVPVPSPQDAWTNSLAKHVVYRLAPSVGELDTVTGELLPVTLTNNRRVVVDAETISMEEPPAQYSDLEVIADTYVGAVNRLFFTGRREDSYTV